MFIDAGTPPLVSCMYKFVSDLLLLYFSLAGQGPANSIKRNCVAGWFVRMADHPILTLLFKNNLRTFESEILKIFKFTVQFETEGNG